MSGPAHPRAVTALWVLFVSLVISAAYLYAFPTPNIFYAVIVLLHAGLGAVALLVLLPWLWRSLRNRNFIADLHWWVLGIAGLIGAALLFIGTSRPEWNWLYLHIALSLIAVVLSAVRVMRWRGLFAPGFLGTAARAVVAIVVLAGISAAAWWWREPHWQKTHYIKNPQSVPETMEGEGDGPNGPFFPSSAQVAEGKMIPGQFFMESQACERCHADIYKQWYSSVHHFSSFNNQWYRKSIEYMQDVVGTKPSKWCGGCHDPAVLYSGLMDTPIKQIINRPESQAGLGCVMCHSIAQVKSTMGQGDFVLEYPELHDLAATKNPIIRTLHDFVIRLNPEPHRRVFLKPFMRTQPAEFCSSCHKVHLDVPVNHYRWIRGFNEYDNWQASGVSGLGARSFYYPPQSQNCVDCHMPQTASSDAGNVKGFVHSHSFPGANTAVPTANEDQKQLALSTAFLNGSVSVDIFAVSPARRLQAGEAAGSDIATTFAVGEEAESAVPAAANVEAARVTAPLNVVNASVRRGDDVLVDVVVRTRRLGHFFPGGTVDAYDTWVELKATDDNGRVIFWSGMVEDDGRGPVEKGAHFYRSLQIDANGNMINKRNAWAGRATVYVRLIPPGAADTVHYRLHVPQDVGNRIKLQARLCYRKFAWWNTQFSFAGEPDAAQRDAKYASDFDDRRFVFTASTANVSGALKRIPDLPVVEISKDEVTLQVLPRSAPAPQPKISLRKEDWTRWNDYGIGLLLQGDLKDARVAFEKITEIDPGNPDGWVNLGRVAVQEGDMERARQVLEVALRLAPSLARANFFYARVLRNDGRYPEAEQHLEKVIEQYPRDRVVRNELGRVLFLERRYPEAVSQFKAALDVDPEDLQAHYNLMLCYNGLGDEKAAERERRLYMRFKADEASQTLTGDYRRLHPEDNNERQPIHEHVSVPARAMNGSSGSTPIMTPVLRAKVGSSIR